MSRVYPVRSETGIICCVKSYNFANWIVKYSKGGGGGVHKMFYSPGNFNSALTIVLYVNIKICIACTLFVQCTCIIYIFYSM